MRAFDNMINVTDIFGSFTWLIVYAALITCHAICAFNEENEDAYVCKKQYFIFLVTLIFSYFYSMIKIIQSTPD